MVCALLFTASATPAGGQQVVPGSQPENADPNFEQGLLALKESRLEVALEKFTAAEHADPRDAKVRNFRGIALAALGRSAEAITEYREATRLDPTMSDAYRNLGFVEWTSHDLNSARTDLARAVELSTQDSFAHYYLGRVELDAQRYREAFEQLSQSDVPWPDDPGFLLQVASGYVALDRDHEARNTLDKAGQLHLSDAQSAHLAYLRLQLHQEGAAIGLLRQLSSNAPSPPLWVQFDTAIAHISSGNYKEAAAEAQSYLASLDPAAPSVERAQAFSLIGIANARAGNGNASVDALQNAAKLAPLQEESWLNLTRELMELSRYADALSALQEALASNPKSYALHLRLGAAYLARGRYKEAELAFRELVSAGDPLPTSYIGLAQVLLRTGRADEAVAELSEAQAKLGPTFLTSYFLGLSWQRAAKPAEALVAFQDALRLKPESSEARLGAGKAELSLGHPREAIGQLEAALRLNPSDVEARRLLSVAYRRAGDLQNAEQYSRSANAPPAPPAGDLVGDFFLPPWKYPPSAENR